MGTKRFPVNGFYMNQTVSIGERLREERQRLDLNQTQLGEQGGVTKKTQMLYESGERFPDAAYLAAIAVVGADVRYIVTGEREGPPPLALSSDEMELLSLFRAAPLAVKAAAIGALQGGTVPSNTKVKKQVQVNAAGGQAAGRDINNGGRKS